MLKNIKNKMKKEKAHHVVVCRTRVESQTLDLLLKDIPVKEYEWGLDIIIDQDELFIPNNGIDTYVYHLTMTDKGEKLLQEHLYDAKFCLKKYCDGGYIEYLKEL